MMPINKKSFFANKTKTHTATHSKIHPFICTNLPLEPIVFFSACACACDRASWTILLETNIVHKSMQVFNKMVLLQGNKMLLTFFPDVVDFVEDYHICIFKCSLFFFFFCSLKSFRFIVLSIYFITLFWFIDKPSCEPAYCPFHLLNNSIPYLNGSKIQFGTLTRENGNNIFKNEKKLINKQSQIPKWRARLFWDLHEIRIIIYWKVKKIKIKRINAPFK